MKLQQVAAFCSIGTGEDKNLQELWVALDSDLAITMDRPASMQSLKAGIDALKQQPQPSTPRKRVVSCQQVNT